MIMYQQPGVVRMALGTQPVAAYKGSLNDILLQLFISIAR